MRRRWNSCRYEKGGGVGETDVHFRPRDFRISDFPGFPRLPDIRFSGLPDLYEPAESIFLILPNWLVVIFPIPTSFQEFENIPQIASFVHTLSVHYLSYNNICEVLPPNERFCTVVVFGDIPQNAYFSHLLSELSVLYFPYQWSDSSVTNCLCFLNRQTDRLTDWALKFFDVSELNFFLYLHALVLISYLRPQSGGGAQVRKISNLCNKRHAMYILSHAKTAFLTPGIVQSVRAFWWLGRAHCLRAWRSVLSFYWSTTGGACRCGYSPVPIS